MAHKWMVVRWMDNGCVLWKCRQKVNRDEVING